MGDHAGRSALREAAGLPEPRGIEVRLLTSIGLLLGGGLIWALFIMGDDIQQGVGSINRAYLGASQPASCGPEELPSNAQGVAAAIAASPSLPAEQPQADLHRSNAAAGWTPGAAAPASRRPAAGARGSKPAPNYIRRPEPEADPAPAVLEALRRSL
jgi:hypothetical protein